MRPVCLYVLGTPPDDVRAADGDYVDWFSALWAERPIRVVPVDGTDERTRTDPRDFAAIVITGSASSVAGRETEPVAWIERAIDLVREAERVATPLLGVCFGHQLIGAAVGGRVVRNPLGWELATFDVELTDAGATDPLFAGLERTISVNLSHEDVVDRESLPERATVLARNPRADVQAMAVGETLRGVQFHPEFSGAVTRKYMKIRHELLVEASRIRSAPDEHPDALAPATRDCPDAVRVFDNFTTHFILRA